MAQGGGNTKDGQDNAKDGDSKDNDDDDDKGKGGAPIMTLHPRAMMTLHLRATMTPCPMESKRELFLYILIVISQTDFTQCIILWFACTRITSLFMITHSVGEDTDNDSR
jgi:hypothetical protein